MQSLKRPVLSGILFFSTVLLCSWAYSAYIWLSSATSTSTLSSTEWNNMVSDITEFQSKLSAISSNGGNVGIGVASPSATLDVNGDFIRTIPRWQWVSPSDVDTGALPWRSFSFTKKYAATGIRVTWSDNFRALGNANACSWEVLFNWASCSNPWLLRFDKYEGGTSSNRHDPSTYIATCFGISAGTVTISTRVTNPPGYSWADCYTGWNSAVASIEAEEVR